MCDLEFKPDLTAKVCQLIQRFSPEKRWHVDSMIQARPLNPIPECLNPRSHVAICAIHAGIVFRTEFGVTNTLYTY